MKLWLEDTKVRNLQLINPSVFQLMAHWKISVHMRNLHNVKANMKSQDQTTWCICLSQRSLCQMKQMKWHKFLAGTLETLRVWPRPLIVRDPARVHRSSWRCDKKLSIMSTEGVCVFCLSIAETFLGLTKWTVCTVRPEDRTWGTLTNVHASKPLTHLLCLPIGQSRGSHQRRFKLSKWMQTNRQVRLVGVS